MTTTVHAYQVQEPGGRLEPTEFELGPLGVTEVDVDVLNCGICYTDVSMIDNDWGASTYPIVPGHEIIGTVRAVGEQVSHLAVGDVVGIGFHASYCMSCEQCMSGDHNLCAAAKSTFIGRAGGYADIVRSDAAAAFKLPDNVDVATAGPLMCGGITVFAPLVQLNILPTARVGVIGIGGLGHLAVKFANAWGCEVTAFTSTEAKRQEARDLGAHQVLDSRDPDAIASAADSFDLLISTVNASLDWDALLATLRRRGHLHVLGIVPEPLTIPMQSLLGAQRSVSSSPAGRPSDIANMLEFAGRHGIQPVTETFPFDQINEAVEHLRAGKARYRVVIEH